MPACDLCGQEMLLDVREESERADDARCGIPPRQYVCFCNGGNYRRATPDTLCECNHWYEEHTSDGCGDCDCAQFVYCPDYNTPDYIAGRGSDGHQAGCLCAWCEHVREGGKP